jgi:hypothetical protein
MEVFFGFLIIGAIGVILYGIYYIFSCYFGTVLICIAVIVAIFLFIILICFLDDQRKHSLQNQGVALILGTYIVVSISTIMIGKNWYENKPDQQIARMSDMQESLKKQIGKISDVQNTYHKRIQELKREIQEEKKRTGVYSLSNATERMNYNIRLIQEQDAYWFKLSEIQIMTQKGLEEAIFMKRKLEARKTMSEVVADGKDLGAEINGLLKTYSPYANKVAINPKELKFKPLEVLWQTYGM